MEAHDEIDVVPPPMSAMSSKLLTHVSDAGLICLKAILENSGITTFSCLGRLSEAEVEETCTTVRSAGFGLGHARALRELSSKARAEAEGGPGPLDKLDAAPVLANLLSPQLHAQLAKHSLERVGSVLGQCGVQSWHCFGKLSSRELDELTGVVKAVGFDQRHVDALRDMHGEALQAETGCTAVVKEENDVREPNGTSAAAIDDPSAQAFQEKEGDVPTSGTAIGAVVASPSRTRRFSESWGNDSGALMRPAKQPRSVAKSETAELDAATDVTPGQVAPKEEQHTSEEEPKKLKEAKLEAKAEPPAGEVKAEPDLEEQRGTSVNTKGNLCCRQARVSRQAVLDILRNVRVFDTEVVKYRDQASGKMLDARVPKAVLALLRLHVTCSGKEVSEQRIARMAMDVLEEQAYDPIRAVASLSPASLLCPTSAMRVLGSGYVGIVFLEEETDIVVKVMLEDFANKEYEIFCGFAKAGLAPRPLEIIGPCTMPAGSLYSIRMARVPHTLQGVLTAKVPGGPRKRLSPPSEGVAQSFGLKLVTTLQSMFDNGLVHGDLHLENVGLQTPDAEMPFLLFDFGRSSSMAGLDENCKGAFLAGHEYDVYRLITELCASFDDLQVECSTSRKECERELRELKKLRDPRTPQKEHQLHIERQVVGLQAYVVEEPKTLEQAELAYSAILGAVVRYANTKFAVPYDGVPCVRSRRMRQTSMKREKAAFRLYFQSDLFWAGVEP